MDEIQLDFGGDTQVPFEKPQPVDKSVTLAALTPEEQKQVFAFVSKIDITDSNSVITYGSGAQTKLARFADDTLKNVKTKDSGEAGKLLSDLVVTIQNFESVGESKGFIGNLFGKAKTEVDKIVARYSDVEVNIDKISTMLESHRRVMLKDIAMYDEMFKTNLAYFKELTMYIIAGKEKITEMNEKTIPALQAQVAQSGDEVEAQRLNDLMNAVSRFEKKIYDLQLSRQISLQMGPQIRLIQNNSAQLADKIQSSIVNSIPLWKNQMVIALGLANTKVALEAQTKVTDMTNDLLKKNAEMLKMGTLAVAKESERGIVSMDTIKKTNQDLIDTIQGVIEIQRTGKEERAAAEVELVAIEARLKDALISAR